jgi:hypothetical protein
MQFALLSALSLAAAAAAQVVCDSSFLSHGCVNLNNLFQKTIQVGTVATASGGIFQFIPPSVNAPNGTVITFQFSGMYVHHTLHFMFMMVQVARSQPRKPFRHPINLF